MSKCCANRTFGYSRTRVIGTTLQSAFTDRRIYCTWYGPLFGRYRLLLWPIWFAADTIVPN